jgi:hypothetical protein
MSQAKTWSTGIEVKSTMLTRIAFIAPPGSSQQKLRAQLSRPLAYVVREFQSLEDVHSGLAKFPFEVLITRLAKFEATHVPTIERLSALFPQAGLITISANIDAKARFAIRNVKRHSLIDEELELGDLDRIIAKAAKPWEKSVARMHPRAKRQDEAVLVTTDEMMSKDAFHEARFLDFARMGARLQVSPLTASRLTPKCRLELRYRSSEDLQRVHRLEARVVWIKKTNPLESVLAGSKFNIGVRFVAEL